MVGQIEKIIREKEAENAKLKKANPSKVIVRAKVEIDHGHTSVQR